MKTPTSSTFGTEETGIPNCIIIKAFPMGEILGKMTKNCMKITKSTFLGQNSVGAIKAKANSGGSEGIPGSSQTPPWETWS